MEKALLMLSGGLDSAYCMWNALRRGQRLRVHHISLVNRMGRAPYEDAAAEAIVRWCHSRYSTPFEYTRSVFDYGSMRYITRDVALWSFVGSQILAEPTPSGGKPIGEWIVTRHAGSDETGGDLGSYDRIITTMQMTVANRSVPLRYEIGDMTKGEIMAKMPAELRQLAWYCRMPVGGSPCNRCATCKQVHGAGVPV